MNIFWNVLHENMFTKEMIYERSWVLEGKQDLWKQLWYEKYDAMYECI